jgi:hypothetical protein
VSIRVQPGSRKKTRVRDPGGMCLAVTLPSRAQRRAVHCVTPYFAENSRVLIQLCESCLMASIFFLPCTSSFRKVRASNICKKDVSASRHKKREIDNILFATNRGLMRTKVSKERRKLPKRGLHGLTEAGWSAPLRVPHERLKARFWPGFDISAPAFRTTRTSPKTPDIAQQPLPVLARSVMRF